MHKLNKALPAKAFQRGLSLVELMIAMAISVTLLAGILQIILSNKSTYNFQQSQSVNHENSRFAYYFIDLIASKAGYINAPQNLVKEVFPAVNATTECAAFRPGQVVANNLEGTGICIRYQANSGTELDCAGNNITTTTGFVTRLFYSNANNSLMCGAQGAPAVALVDNIEDLQIVYRVKNSATSIADVATPTADQWADVVAIRTAILTTSIANTADTPQTYRFPLDSTTTTTATDRRVYRSSYKTITLKNSVL